MRSEITRAIALFNDQAATSYVDAATQMVADRLAIWVRDPEVPGVVGLLDREDGRALVIVYLEYNDFEVTEDMHAAVAAR